MKLRFIILVLLALLMTAGFAGAGSATEPPITITSISINTSVPAPATGATAVINVNCSSDNATVDGGVKWNPPVGGKFEVDTEYTAKIIIKANSGYNFTSMTKLTVAGSGDWDAEMDDDNTTITATKKFGKTVKIPISSITVSGITAPVAGHTPNTTKPVVIGTGVDNSTVESISWKTSSDSTVSSNFTYNTVYKVMFEIGALNEYEFTSATNIIVSGGTGSITTASGKNGIITITYPETEADPNNKESITKVAISGIDIPITGGTPDKDAAISSTPSSSVNLTNNITWDCNTSNSKFADNTQYTVTVAITAKSGYIFTSSTTATINGLTANKSSFTNDTLVLTYKFPATRNSVSKVYLTITEPSEGKTPVTKVKSNLSSVNYNSSKVTWDPGDVKFKAGEEYTATIIVPAASGYTFLDPKPTVYLNGKLVESGYVSVDDDILNFKYKFIDQISKIYLEVAEPSIGLTPADSAKSSQDFVYVKDVKWSPDSPKFLEGTTYTVTINIDLDDDGNDDVYATSLSFYINNNIASGEHKTDGTYDVSYTFTTAKEISKVAVTLNPPVTGGLAPPTAQIQSNPYPNAVDGTVSWDPPVSKFAAETAYTAKIAVTTFSGYKFASSVSATVNGYTADVTRNSDSSITISYKYPQTEKAVTAAIVQTQKTLDNEETENTNTTSPIPNPIGIIQEFVRLFMSLFNFDNYLIFQSAADTASTE